MSQKDDLLKRVSIYLNEMDFVAQEKVEIYQKRVIIVVAVSTSSPKTLSGAFPPAQHRAEHFRYDRRSATLPPTHHDLSARGQ